MNFFSHLQDKHHITLNDQQREAVRHGEGPALVLAGPGSGKTTIITARTARLLMSGVSRDRILTLTFNKAAQLEMQNCFHSIFGEAVPGKVRFSTFHSFCYSILRDYEKKRGRRFRLIEGSPDGAGSKAAILREIYREVNGSGLNDDELETLMNEIGLVKNRMAGEEDYAALGLETRRFADIYRAYEDYKRKDALIDFDDMLVYAHSILRRRPGMLGQYRERYRYYQIDEAQDLSKLQFEILWLLVPQERANLFLVADDDQSIYGFRGAEPRSILDMEKRFAGLKLYKLENNYRSSRNIVEISSRFIKANKQRYDKDHTTLNGYRLPPLIISPRDGIEQLKWLEKTILDLWRQDGDMRISVLYRNNLSSVALADYFDRRGIPFCLRQNRVFFHKHWMVQDIIAFFRFALNPCDRESFMRICYRMNRYISRAMTEEALEKPDGSVIDAIIGLPSLNKYQKARMIDLKQEFRRFSRMSPAKALDYIEREFKYFGSVKDFCDRTGQSLEGVLRMFGILRTIAEGTPSLNSFLNRMNELEAMLESPPGLRRMPHVALSTLHASKGLEFDAVFMVDLIQDEIPGQRALSQLKSGGESLMEEERRLFYVGMTRARSLLCLVSPEQNHGTPLLRSTFVGEVECLINGESAGEIRTGAVISHRKYGRGIITGIERKAGKPAIIQVDFKGKVRTLDLDTCLEYGIITF